MYLLSCLLVLFLLALVQLGGCLLLGAFNIKTFGDKKSSNSTLMDIITQIVHRYDIVLIQEVRDTDLSATNKLMQHVNKFSNYIQDSIMYLYLHNDKETVSVAKNYTYDDGCEPCGTDTFIREPFIVMFSSNYTAVRNFEVDALYDVAADVRARWNTNDIVLLGDFNAGCRYVSGSDWQLIRLFTDHRYHWLIPDHADTTVSNTDCPYDRVVATTEMMRGVVPGSAEVFNYMTHLKLSHSMVLFYRVSHSSMIDVVLQGQS
uniref:Deoxyribonuclease n=1 Tax=Oncorhynchus tshawytscha TaxID=74940 RepID=A0AAZ3SFV2_ONCTS